MNEYGYEALFFQGYSDISFDNTGTFARNLAFDHVHGMNDKFISVAERDKYYWGWGIQDDVMYENYFEYLDAVHEKDPQKKLFSALTTTSNHMRFAPVPVSQRKLYPQQANEKEYYANSVRISDEYLKTFMEEFYQRDYLKNPIILLTGDHGFPVGEHGNYRNEHQAFEENFKTPLLII